MADDSAYKIAWESRRFWEQDFNIYGGISYVSNAVTAIWYPSDRMFSPRGVVVAGYGLEGGEFGQMNLQAKLAASRAAVETLMQTGRSRERLHPASMFGERSTGGRVDHEGRRSARLTPARSASRRGADRAPQ